MERKCVQKRQNKRNINKVQATELSQKLVITIVVNKIKPPNQTTNKQIRNSDCDGVKQNPRSCNFQKTCLR